MKPIATLKYFQKAKTPAEVITNILAITTNPKRHLRGPRFGLRPGTGKIQSTNNEGTIKNAIAACGNGLIDLTAKGGRKGQLAAEVRDLLNTTTHNKYGFDVKSFATISDKKGLKAFRQMLTTTLKEIQASV